MCMRLRIVLCVWSQNPTMALPRYNFTLSKQTRKPPVCNQAQGQPFVEIYFYIADDEQGAEVMIPLGRLKKASIPPRTAGRRSKNVPSSAGGTFGLASMQYP